jgi:DNA repair protein RadD
MVVPSFQTLIQRADEVLLQEWLGRPALKLLQAINGKALPSSRLRAVLGELTSPAGMLANPKIRTSLLGLLRPDEVQSLVEGLGERRVVDPFRAASALQYARGGARFRNLLNLFGVEEEHQETPPFEAESISVQGAYPLFDHQRRAVTRTVKALKEGNRRVLLHMPTGSGKTRTAMNVIARFLREVEPMVVVWLATSEELCAQAASEFDKCWSTLGDREVTLYRFWGPHDLKITNVTDGIVVAGLQKLHSAGIRNIPFLGRLGDKTSLVVIDEAHQAVAPSYRSVIDSLLARNPQGALLGLTATPGRTWDQPTEDKELAKYFAERKVTLEVKGFSSPVDYLIDQGYLARPNYRSLRYTSREELTDAELKSLAADLEIPMAVLERLASDELRNMAIIREIERLVTVHRRTLLFSATVEHASLLATVLRSLGVAAKSVSGATPSDERSRIIAWYKDKAPEPRVLANFGVLTTGFDAPATSATVIARPTKSLVLYSQMVGRATRGVKAGGNRAAEVVTVVDTALPGFGDMAEAFNNWEDIW